MRDPLYDDIPWEFIYDEEGFLIGAIYLILPTREAVRCLKKQKKSSKQR